MKFIYIALSILVSLSCSRTADVVPPHSVLFDFGNGHSTWSDDYYCEWTDCEDGTMSFYVEAPDLSACVMGRVKRNTATSFPAANQSLYFEYCSPDWYQLRHYVRDDDGTDMGDWQVRSGRVRVTIIHNKYANIEIDCTMYNYYEYKVLGIAAPDTKVLRAKFTGILHAKDIAQ